MDSLLERNIYDVKGKVLICGTCLHRMYPNAYEELSSEYDTILTLCLEKEHINVAITKICGILSTKNVTSLTFASVNRSPHCTQLHYIKHEIKRVMNTKELPELTNIIIQDNQRYIIDEDTLELSKDLIKLSNLKK